MAIAVLLPSVQVAGRLAVLLGIASLLALCCSYSRTLWLRRQLPPGLFPLPIVGNVLALPATKPWTTFKQWSRDYGSPLIPVWIGRTPTVVVNDCWTASDLLGKRADVYFSRPTRVVMGDHLAVGSQVVHQYRDFQADEAAVLMKDLLVSPAEYVASLERYSCSVVSIIGWGRSVAARDEAYGRARGHERPQRLLNGSNPGAATPALVSLPFA